MKSKFVTLFMIFMVMGSVGLVGCETNGAGEGLEETGEEFEQGTEEMQQEMDQGM